MSFTHQHTISLAGGSSTLSGVITATADSKEAFDIDLTSAEADKQIAVAIDVSALASLFVFATGDITLKTNSTSDPDDTISVPANTPFRWTSAESTWYPCPLTADVTTLYITNGESDATNVKIEILTDSTP